MSIPTNQELFEISRQLAEIADCLIGYADPHRRDPDPKLRALMLGLRELLGAISEEIPSLAEQQRQATSG